MRLVDFNFVRIVGKVQQVDMVEEQMKTQKNLKS